MQDCNAGMGRAFNGVGADRDLQCTWSEEAGALQELDPTSKFSSISNAFVWRATSGGADVPLAQCCSADGFSSSCVCAPRTDMTGCPPAGTLLNIDAN